jgi:hypothetical protein
MSNLIESQLILRANQFRTDIQAITGTIDAIAYQPVAQVRQLPALLRTLGNEEIHL